MAEAQKYQGSCHCGAVAFEATLNLEHLVTCNCSLCSRSGAILTFIPSSQFVLVSGEDKLTDYQFNKKVIHHLFCSVCGVRPFGRGTGPDGSEMIAVNVRCIHDIDVFALQPTQFDGKNR